MIDFKFIPLDAISDISDDWRELESGADMSYFQSYDWYQMLSSLNSSIKDKRFTIEYVVAKKDGSSIIIAPLWIVNRTFGKHNRKGVYLFGRGQWSDYLNFIYRDWNDDIASLLFQQISYRYHTNRFYFENIKQDTELAKFINKNFKVNNKVVGVCVKLTLPTTWLEYQNSLSKNARQNIRTAHNRAVKDGIELVYNFNDQELDIAEFAKYRAHRVIKKNQFNGRSLKWEICNYISTKILKRGWYRFKEYNPYTDDVNSKFLSLKTSDGKLCAAFNYGLDRTHKQIVLMAVSTNELFSRYSPGMLLLYAFIKKLIADNNISTLDFTRGNERYKYVLGGKDHFIDSLEFTI